MRANTSPLENRTDRTTPNQSVLMSRLGAELGTTRMTVSAIDKANGTLTRNSDPHQNRVSRAPASSGAMMLPADAVAAQIPTARRSSPSVE